MEPSTGPCLPQHGVCLHIENKFNIHIILLLKSANSKADVSKQFITVLFLFFYNLYNMFGMEDKLSGRLFGGRLKLLKPLFEHNILLKIELQSRTGFYIVNPHKRTSISLQNTHYRGFLSLLGCSMLELARVSSPLL